MVPTRLLTVLLTTVALAAAVATAPADPPVRRSTCDHSGISSTITKRHVNYLSVSTYIGCTRAQHIARLWVHDHACASTCNIWEGNTAVAYCVSTTHADGERTANCSSYSYIIGWVRTP
jgi:hypothetical protein